MTALTAGKLWGLRRLADTAGRFKMLAVDQRPPIKQVIAERRRREPAPYQDVCDVKALLTEVLAPQASAVLLDPHYGYPAAVHLADPRHGLLVTLEDSVFTETAGGRRSRAIDEWSVDKIKRIGADAVKVLAWYRPDAAPEVNDHQQQFVAAVGDTCRTMDIPFVFELLVYPMPTESGHTLDYVEQPDKKADHVIESVATFAESAFGVDLFKLESPIPAETVASVAPDAVAAAFTALDAAAGRPWVMLSAGASPDSFRAVLEHAYRAGASGYLAGRAIWWDALSAFPDLDTMRTALEASGLPYMAELNRLTDASAMPWHRHPLYGAAPTLHGAGPGFRTEYR